MSSDIGCDTVIPGDLSGSLGRQVNAPFHVAGLGQNRTFIAQRSTRYFKSASENDARNSLAGYRPDWRVSLFKNLDEPRGRIVDDHIREAGGLEQAAVFAGLDDAVAGRFDILPQIQASPGSCRGRNR